MVGKRLWAGIVAVDILIAALLFGARPGETISHMAGRKLDSWGGPLCAILDRIDPDHCAKVRF